MSDLKKSKEILRGVNAECELRGHNMNTQANMLSAALLMNINDMLVKFLEREKKND